MIAMFIAWRLTRTRFGARLAAIPRERECCAGARIDSFRRR
jgi:hypothetical protein